MLHKIFYLEVNKQKREIMQKKHIHEDGELIKKRLFKSLYRIFKIEVLPLFIYPNNGLNSIIYYNDKGGVNDTQKNKYKSKIEYHLSELK